MVFHNSAAMALVGYWNDSLYKGVHLTTENKNYNQHTFGIIKSAMINQDIQRKSDNNVI